MEKARQTEAKPFIHARRCRFEKAYSSGEFERRASSHGETIRVKIDSASLFKENKTRRKAQEETQ
jgi:hypothetical protein